jgi:hypothetical protein
LNYLGLEPSAAARVGMDENVLPIRLLEVVVEVEAHPGGREQLRQWCGGMMPSVLPPNNVALVVEGWQPTPAYQPLGGCARTAGHTKVARCPRHCKYLSASKACIVSFIIMLHLQSKDRTTYVRNGVHKLPLFGKSPAPNSVLQMNLIMKHQSLSDLNP